MLDDAPVLHPRLSWVLSMFHDLRTCRPVSMGGMMPIPVTEMRNYFTQLGYPESQWHEAKTHLMALDSVELEHFGKIMKSKMPTEPKGFDNGR